MSSSCRGRQHSWSANEQTECKPYANVQRTMQTMCKLKHILSKPKLCKPSANQTQVYANQKLDYIPRLLAAVAGSERLRGTACNLPSSVVLEQQRLGMSLQHPGLRLCQTWAASVHHCGRLDPSSTDCSCACAVMNRFQKTCRILHICELPCLSAAARIRSPSLNPSMDPGPPTRNPSLRRAQTQSPDRGLSELQRQPGTETGS